MAAWYCRAVGDVVVMSDCSFCSITRSTCGLILHACAVFTMIRAAGSSAAPWYAVQCPDSTAARENVVMRKSLRHG